MSKRMLVTGSTGSLGSVVYRRARRAGWNIVGTSFNSAWRTADLRLDIRAPANVHAVVAEVRPDVVVHTATGRDRDDWAATADGAANVAAAAAAVGARLVHVSSDAVHDDSEHPYDESALPNPVTRYGSAKAAAETAVKACCPTAAIVRTALILGDGNGYAEKLTHDLVAERVYGFLFTDMIRHSAHVDDLSDALLELAGNDYGGVINVSGPEAMSRYELGVLIAQRDGLDPAAIPATRAARANSPLALRVRLDTGRAEALLRTRLRGATEFLTVGR